jgi:hypothetical protein
VIQFAGWITISVATRLPGAEPDAVSNARPTTASPRDAHESNESPEQSGYLPPPLPRRPLSGKERRTIAELADKVINKDLDEDPRSTSTEEREKSLGKLWSYRHIHCVPIFLAIIRDPSDAERLRRHAVLAMSYVNDKRVVDYLIEALTANNFNVAYDAENQLMKLTDHALDSHQVLDPDPSSKSRRDLQRAWRKWWSENRDNTNLNSIGLSSDRARPSKSASVKLDDE